MAAEDHRARKRRCQIVRAPNTRRERSSHDQSSLRRAILAAKLLVGHVIGIRPDGTLIIGDHATTLASTGKDDSDLSKWQKVRA
jgi:hypothetical protein